MEPAEVAPDQLAHGVEVPLGGNGVGPNADDILQDIWLIVFKKIGKLKEASAFPVWLYRIARNKVYSGFRRKDRFLSLPKVDEIPVSVMRFRGEDRLREKFPRNLNIKMLFH